MVLVSYRLIINFNFKIDLNFTKNLTFLLYANLKPCKLNILFKQELLKVSLEISIKKEKDFFNQSTIYIYYL